METKGTCRNTSVVDSTGGHAEVFLELLAETGQLAVAQVVGSLGNAEAFFAEQPPRLFELLPYDVLLHGLPVMLPVHAPQVLGRYIEMADDAGYGGHGTLADLCPDVFPHGLCQLQGPAVFPFAFVKVCLADPRERNDGGIDTGIQGHARWGGKARQLQQQLPDLVVDMERGRNGASVLPLCEGRQQGHYRPEIPLGIAQQPACPDHEEEQQMFSGFCG